MATKQRRPRGPGSARRRKEERLGIAEVDALSKPMLDALHAESLRLYKLGIGVLLQEENRSRKLIESLRADPWYKRMLPGHVLAARGAASEHRLWDGRIADCANAVASKRAPR